MVNVMVSFLLSKLFSNELAPQELFLFKFGALYPCERDQQADQITMKPFAFLSGILYLHVYLLSIFHGNSSEVKL